MAAVAKKHGVSPSMKTHFSRLAAAYAITLGDRLFPGAGAYGVGAVVPVMPDEASARAWVADVAEDIASLNLGVAGITPVGDPWKFMRRAASEGLAGIEGAIRERFSDRFMFMVRVEDAGSVLPTVLASITEAGWDTCLTRAGEKKLDHAEVLHWQRFDILDQVTGQWGQTCPFRGWEQGDTLYELASDSIVVLLANVPLLGDWNSTEGAFAFFTSEEQATHYQHQHLGDGRNRMIFHGANAPLDPHEAMASLAPRPIIDLRSRLEQLSEINPFANWCINPDGHRENSAYGRLIPFGQPPVGKSKKANSGPQMTAVSGIWTVMPSNHFDLDKPLAPWSGKDTIRWTGSQSLQLLPLDRSFVLDRGLESIEIDDEMTESDAEELVAHELDAVDLEDSWEQLTETQVGDADPLDQFHIVCWDSVTGEGAENPWRFSGFFEAARHLAAYEREHDRRHRIEGAVSCGHIGFSGSGDAHFEDLRSSRFRLGLRRLLLRVLRRKRYHPSDATDLVALCNGTLSTLHTDYAGYSKDLLWSSSSEQRSELLDALDIYEDDWLAWLETANVTVDPTGELLAKERICDEDWSLLPIKTKHFLATALLHLDEQGHAPQLDYAPISLEVAKALEVELVDVLAGFATQFPDSSFQSDPEDRAEQSFVEFLSGKKAPTLGAMPYLLKAPKPASSQLRFALYDYLTKLPNASFLTSKAFAEKGLRRVVDKFRNGGAHDSAIPESICRECVDVLIGTRESPGYIPLVAAWKKGTLVDPETNHTGVC